MPEVHAYKKTHKSTNIHCLKTWCRTFESNFINCLPILKILSLLETEMNCLTINYNTFCHFLKTSLRYRVKHKSLKNVAIMFYQSLVNDKAAPNFYANFVNC